MNVVQLEPFGIEITDIDLSRERSAEETARLLELFNEHYLLVVRGQNLSDDDHLRVFHDLFPGEDLGDESGDGTEISYVSNVRADGLFGDGRLAFHSDFSFTTDPTRLISLYGTDVDPGSAATEFSNGELAFRKLPDALRTYLEDKKVVCATDMMAFETHLPSYNVPGQEDLSGRTHEEILRAAWPVVMNHPRTGRPLVYVNELHAHHLHDVPLAKGREVLEQICDYLYRPAHIFTHEWSTGDFVLWDNIALSHGRRATPPTSAKRTLRRVRGGGATTPTMSLLSQRDLDGSALDAGDRSEGFDLSKRTLGQRMRTFRLAKGWTQRDLSDATGIEFKHIALCENALRLLSMQELSFVADALGVDREQLTGGLALDALVSEPSA